MIVDTRVLVIARLAEIGHALTRLKDLPAIERFHARKKLRAERQRLTHELASSDCLVDRGKPFD
jgi:hypothetical protein